VHAHLSGVWLHGWDENEIICELVDQMHIQIVLLFMLPEHISAAFLVVGSRNSRLRK